MPEHLSCAETRGGAEDRTGHADAEGFDNLTSFVREHLPEIPQQPGFRGSYLLRDPDSDELMTISLWETKEHLQASVARAADQAAPAAVLTELRSDTYEVALSA